MSFDEPPLSIGDAASYARMAEAVELLASREGNVSLEEAASSVGLSPFHFQRIFTAWAGVSPKEFQQASSLLRAKRALRAEASVLQASLDAGLSGPSRLHDLFLSLERMTPGEFKSGGEGLALAWDVVGTPLGEAILVAAPRGLCHFGFLDPSSTLDLALGRVRADWPRADLRRDPPTLEPYASEIVRRLSGLGPGSRLGLLLRGTDLRVRVWMALLEIPPSETRTYAEVARAAGSPLAVRAVASSVAANPIAFLIPCHRVIRASGALGEYRWGVARKTVLLAREQA